MRRTISMILAATIILTAAAPAWAGSAAFWDLGNHWAGGPIQKMYLKGVVKGYADGAYRANDSVRRVEAIVMLDRVLGLEEQAQAATYIPAAFFDQKSVDAWARGYIAVAVTKGLISGEDLRALRPNEDALRYEIAVFLVRALGLESEAGQRQGAALSFGDFLSIPKWARGYVAIASEKGLMTGADGLFRPDKPVTRGELAALLARLDKLLDNALDANEVKGTILNVLADPPYSLTLKTAWGSEVTLPVALGSGVYRSGKPAALREIMPYDEVVLQKDSAGNAVFIEAEPAPVRTITGNVTGVVTAGSMAVSLSTADGDKTYTLNTKAMVTRNGNVAVLTDIRPGDVATVRMRAGEIISIEAEAVTRRVKGIIKTITISASPSIAITVGQKDEAFVLATNAVLRKGNRSIDLRSINIGDYVEIEASSNEAKRVDVEAKEVYLELGGVITEVNRADRTFTIAVTPGRMAPADAELRLVKTNPFTIFIKRAVGSGLLDLAVGDRVLVVGGMASGEFLANTVVVTVTSAP